MKIICWIKTIWRTISRPALKHKCVCCKKMFSEKDIEYAPDPYSNEIDNDDTKVWECCECRNESADDI